MGGRVGGNGETGESECEGPPLGGSTRLKKKVLGDSRPELGECAELGPWLELGRGCRKPDVCSGFGVGDVGVEPERLW
jgi:hypothetical protein